MGRAVFVRLDTALNAACENASCAWELDGRLVKVRPRPVGVATGLPRVMSVALSDASLRDVFRALAAALYLDLVVEGDLTDKPVSIKFANAAPEVILNFLAAGVGCVWRIDGGRLIVRRLPAAGGPGG